MKRFIAHISFIFIILMCIFSKECIESAKQAVNTCVYVLLPSLFPFFVFSKIFILTGGAEKLGRYFSNLTKILFNVSPICASSFVLGILCGYPVGAKSSVDLYNNKNITKDEAQNLIGFCNNSGPLFLIGAVGIGMFSSKKIGIMLYLVHILSAISVGIILRTNIKNTITKKENNNILIQENIFVKSVEESVITILNVFGYVILFAVIISFVDNIFLSGFFEMTTAIFKISKSDLTLHQKFVLSAFFASWGGLSVHMQTMGIISKSDLSFKKYLFAKLMHGIIAVIYAFAMINIIDFSKFTFAPNDIYFTSFNPNNILQIINILISGIYLLKMNIILLNKKHFSEE
ncbi:MAG: hypothetical protein E7404_08385 [Ruminococcaceae bacterium]|nr:hypothetical protein [Oscillospiraceae bacterium]